MEHMADCIRRIMDDAFERAKLPTPASDDMPLGSVPFGMWTNHVLKLAGITVERVGTPAYGDESDCTMHCTVQIVSEEKLQKMMSIDSLENISMCENNEALGLQVKLHNACAWKVTILADIPQCRAVPCGVLPDSVLPVPPICTLCYTGYHLQDML